MNSIAKRSYFAMGLAVLLLFGLATFLVRYVLYAGRWVTYSGSPHVYNDAGTLDTGTVTDRSGTLLYDASGSADYASEAPLRKATLHLLGDREGNIPARLLTKYAEQLVGFNAITGTYGITAGGGACTLTLSAQVQVLALQALDGRKGTVGVYNYKTGEILCAVTSPTYDPDNVPDIAGDTSGAYEGAYVNRFFDTTYPPGSIFKLVTSIAAIETIPDIFEQTFTCHGTCEIGGETITCQGNHGEIGFKDALAHSCNCAFAQIAVQLGAKTLTSYAEKLGVTSSLSFDGIHTSAGNFDLAGAGENDIAWAGIGQNVDLINACQYMTLMGAVANGGEAASPHLVQRVTCGGITRHSALAGSTGRLLSAQTAETLREMMRYNVEEVYGAWSFPSVTVCAKSGTAEIGGGKSPNATFTGFVTDEDYPLAFIVIVENGGSGSGTAMPIASRVLQACINVLDGEQ